MTLRKNAKFKDLTPKKSLTRVGCFDRSMLVQKTN